MESRILNAEAKKIIDLRNNYIMSHYALLIQYAAGGLSRENLEPALAHFLCVYAAIFPYSGFIEYRGGPYADVFEAVGGVDDVMILDEEKFPDFPIIFARKCVEKGRPEDFAEAILFCMPRGDPNIETAWSFALQNLAKSEGRLSKALMEARESPQLDALPAEFKYINQIHIDELLEMYRQGERCPTCGWEMAYLAAITTLEAGDEFDHVYFQCENCNKYLVKNFHERFMSDDVSVFFSEIPDSIAREDIQKIRKCPDPRNKRCKCDVHRNWN